VMVSTSTVRVRMASVRLVVLSGLSVCSLTGG